jgi:hypothetical protein
MTPSPVGPVLQHVRTSASTVLQWGVASRRRKRTRCVSSNRAAPGLRHNALVGRSEFGGLDSLSISGGRHTIELRADVYVTQSREIDVKIGTTQTVRFSLKKQEK